jgi:hypothetical protein
MHHTFNHILDYVYKKYINYLQGIKCTSICFPRGSYFDASDPPKALGFKFYRYKHLLHLERSGDKTNPSSSM